VIAQAAEWVNVRRPLYDRLGALDDEVARRNLLCECPGIGLKTASWLLRNVGLGQALAVIDIHVLRALAAAGRISEPRLPRDYYAIEQRFLAWCDELNAPPAAFDLMLWVCRGGLSESHFWLHHAGRPAVEIHQISCSC
jgi:thermostable 8-oxoguanine DNA glycosylase